jgi:hypothetical protein
MSKPEKKFRCGPNTASIFAEARVVEGQMAKFYSIHIDKSYKEGEQWKHTTSFATEDLPKVALLANEAYRHLRLRSADDADSPES